MFRPDWECLSVCSGKNTSLAYMRSLVPPPPSQESFLKGPCFCIVYNHKGLHIAGADKYSNKVSKASCTQEKTMYKNRLMKLSVYWEMRLTRSIVRRKSTVHSSVFTIVCFMGGWEKWECYDVSVSHSEGTEGYSVSNHSSQPPVCTEGRCGTWWNCSEMPHSLLLCISEFQMYYLAISKQCVT